MTGKERAAFLSKKGQAFQKLLTEIERPPVDKLTANLSLRAPVGLLDMIDALAKKTKRNRSQVVVMLLDAIVNEMAAEGAFALRDVVGRREKNRL